MSILSTQLLLHGRQDADIINLILECELEFTLFRVLTTSFTSLITIVAHLSMACSRVHYPHLPSFTLIYLHSPSFSPGDEQINGQVPVSQTPQAHCVFINYSMTAWALGLARSESNQQITHNPTLPPELWALLPSHCPNRKLNQYCHYQCCHLTEYWNVTAVQVFCYLCLYWVFTGPSAWFRFYKPGCPPVFWPKFGLLLSNRCCISVSFCVSQLFPWIRHINQSKWAPSSCYVGQSNLVLWDSLDVCNVDWRQKKNVNKRAIYYSYIK